MIANSIAAVLIAVGLPLYLGVGLLSAATIVPLAGLSAFLVGDLVSAACARGLPAKETALLALRGWGTGLALLCLALAVMNLLFWTGTVQLPAAAAAIDALALSFSSSVLVAGLALTLCRKTKSPNRTLKLILVTATLCLVYGCSVARNQGWFYPTLEQVSTLTWVASAFSLVSGAALIAAAARAGRPAR